MNDTETIIRNATRYDPSVVEHLLAEIDRLRALNVGLIERIAAQSHLLTRRAAGERDCGLVETLLAEVARLKAGHFTGEEFQDLCHTFSPGDESAFRRGCVDYQLKLFGGRSAWYGLQSPVFVSFWSA